jgi:2-keto-4-pentenoate hydratase/2-oxohepta-3-ene-1,7-dioic acid hydratase in catechol pathway
MKLVTFVRDGETATGLNVDKKIVDLNAAFRYLAESGKIKARSEKLPRSMKDLIVDETALADAKKVCGYIQDGGQLPEGMHFPFDSVEFAPPITDPGKIICLGGNYRKHCEEGHAPVPPNPILFVKFKSALTATGAAVIKPLATKMLDYEAELVIVIGRRCKDISPDQAAGHVFGYTIMNDISARDIQINDKQWVRAKGFETFAPMGPSIVSADEIPDPHNLGIKMVLNGETMQDDNTSQMVFKIPEIISFISQIFPLEPGDLISTGTPEGVGLYRKPQRLLREGDRMQVMIEKIGTLENHVVEEKAPPDRESWRQQPPRMDNDKIFG